MKENDHKRIAANRIFPRTGTYIGTRIESPEPERYQSEPGTEIDYDAAIQQNAAWYQWNQARMAANSVMDKNILSRATGIEEFTHPRVIQHIRPDADDPGIVDVYVDPPYAIFRNVRTIGRRIAEQTQHHYDVLGVEPARQPTWIPLGQLAFRRTGDLYRFRESYAERSKKLISFVGKYAMQHPDQLTGKPAREFVRGKVTDFIRTRLRKD